jgi:hypothetical protein
VQHLTIFDRASGEWKDGDVLFLRCTLWRQPAENVTQGREDQPQPNSQAIRSRATYGPRRLRSRRQPLVGIAIDCSPGDIQGPCPHPGHRPPGDISHSRHAPLSKRRLVASLGSSPRELKLWTALPQGPVRIRSQTAPLLLRELSASRLPYLLRGPLGAGPPGRRRGARYSQIFKLDRIRPAVVADGLAELQVRWPGVPIVFCETRQLAEEWTYRYLAAARA